MIRYRAGLGALAFVGASATILTACSSGGLDNSSQINTTDHAISNQLFSDDVAEIELEGMEPVIDTPDSDLVIAYADNALPDRVSSDYLVEQWRSMQACLDAHSAEPVVMVYPDWIPNEPSDDVLLNIEGRRLASSTIQQDQRNVIRVSGYDYDGSQGQPGFHTRSIMGRYIWHMNELPPTGYNTFCATQ